MYWNPAEQSDCTFFFLQTEQTKEGVGGLRGQLLQKHKFIKPYTLLAGLKSQTHQFVGARAQKRTLMHCPSVSRCVQKQ